MVLSGLARRYRNRMEFKENINHSLIDRIFVDIETEWNLKPQKHKADARRNDVDIETEWNLKILTKDLLQ